MPRPDAPAIAMTLAALLALGGCASSGPSGNARIAAGETSAVAQRAILSAQSLLAQGKAEDAFEQSQAAIRADSRSAHARIVHAAVLETLGRADEAGESYERAFALAPASGPVLNAYGVWRCRSDQVDAALKAFSDATLDPAYRTPEQALANAASCAADVGRLELAEMNFRAALGLSPANAQALTGLSKLELRRGNLLNARAFLQRREAAGPLGAAELALAVEIESAAGDPRAAARYRNQLATLAAQAEAASSSSANRSPGQ
jgi:type IV pilus assembly protein PilF